jgi:hypothetical protein
MIVDAARTIFALLFYPGLLTSVLLALVVGRVLGGPASGGRAVAGLADAMAARGPIAHAAAVFLILLALGRLPWPGLPWQSRVAVDPWMLWGLVEGSAAAAVLPGLAAAAPTVSRAAVREAQLGLSGRLPIWIGLSVALEARGPSNATVFPPRAAFGLAALAALLALPAAAGWPPFGYAATRNAAPALASDYPLDDKQAALARWTRRLQSIFWLALLAIVFVPLPPLRWWSELLMRLGLIIALAALVRVSQGRFVNLTLPTALRWCWWLALPCALVAVASMG